MLQYRLGVSRDLPAALGDDLKAVESVLFNLTVPILFLLAFAFFTDVHF